MFDLGLQKENMWFRYRAGAIIVEDGCVLLVTNSNEDYYYSVGGGVQWGESSEDAVRREVREETGVDYEVDRLAVIHENFFGENKGTLKGLECHEVAHYYLMKPRGSKELNSNSITHGAKEIMTWIPIDELYKHKAFPTFLADYLAKRPEGIVHIVTHERDGKKAK
jgi:ADP-ribose pyrophosphatase YjhB (NUDIX family)